MLDRAFLTDLFVNELKFTSSLSWPGSTTYQRDCSTIIDLVLLPKWNRVRSTAGILENNTPVLRKQCLKLFQAFEKLAVIL